ncbi:MAG: TonB-dependent receptor plug domain-containing protein [Candidatus Eisenbacteria bacterium]|nr:TonB-dependent receptor plug domain-containing protein [Candidatus Eisenbacteria bacterium]
MNAPRLKSRKCAPVALGSLLVLAVLLTAAPAMGQATGTIAGRVTDASTGEPLGYTNVTVMGTPYGAMANAQGYYSIDFVPVGTYVVKATFISYAEQQITDVVVEADRTVEVDFALREEAIVAEEVVVEAERPMIETEDTTTRRGMDEEEVKVRPINTVQEAVATQPGVVLHEGEIHVRGGRSSEVKMYVDGMAVTNAATGTSNLEVSLSSLSEFELLSGGFDAEYGNVQSGVINLQTREGGREFSGEVKYMTDDYGAPERTYNNYDNLSFGMGGPLFTDKLRYYVSGEGRFSDTYLRTNENRPIHSWDLSVGDTELLSIDARERQSMLGSGQVKLSYFVSPTQKLTGEFLHSRTVRDNYSHSYSREGYWSPEYKDWSHVRLDSTYQYYNAAEHTPTQRTSFTQQKIVWRDNVSPTTFYTLKLAQFESEEKWWLYEDPNDYWWEPYMGGWRENTLDHDSDNDLNQEPGYYRTWGDNLGWSESTTRTTTFKADVTNQPNDTHQLKSGLEFVYNHLDVTELSLGSIIPSEGEAEEEGFQFFDWDEALYTDQRFEHNIYEAFPTHGAMYLQDKMRYEGMIVRAGLRLDWSDPGSKSGVGERQIWRERISAVLSPRLGIAHPISDRDALHFHYGRFYQMPHLTAYYEANEELTGATVGRIIGSSELEPEVTVSYQFGAEHQFSQNLAMDVTGFYKDIFGLLATESYTSEEDPTAEWYLYVNKDYATVRGIEFKLTKRFSNFFSGNMTYTWLQATGVSSDPNQGAQAAAEGWQQPLQEIPLDWDERHTVTGFLFVSDPGNWEVTFDYNYGSGTPYTPTFVGQKDIPPETINSGRLPSHQLLNLRGTKKYKLYGQEFRLFFEALNVFDKKNVRRLGYYGAEYYTETGNLGGAYLETQGENQVLEPLQDPSVFGEGRLIKVGIAIDW